MIEEHVVIRFVPDPTLWQRAEAALAEATTDAAIATRSGLGAILRLGLARLPVGLLSGAALFLWLHYASPHFHEPIGEAVTAVFALTSDRTLIHLAVTLAILVVLPFAFVFGVGWSQRRAEAFSRCCVLHRLLPARIEVAFGTKGVEVVAEGARLAASWDAVRHPVAIEGSIAFRVGAEVVALPAAAVPADLSVAVLRRMAALGRETLLLGDRRAAPSLA